MAHLLKTLTFLKRCLYNITQSEKTTRAVWSLILSDIFFTKLPLKLQHGRICFKVTAPLFLERKFNCNKKKKSSKVISNAVELGRNLYLEIENEEN